MLDKYCFPILMTLVALYQIAYPQNITSPNTTTPRVWKTDLSTAISATTVLLATSSSGLSDDAADLLCANSAVARLIRGLGRVDDVCVGRRDVNADNRGSFEDIFLQGEETVRGLS